MSVVHFTKHFFSIFIMEQPIIRALADSTTGPNQPSNLFERQPDHPPDSTTGSIEELGERRRALQHLQLVARRVQENNAVGAENTSINAL